MKFLLSTALVLAALGVSSGPAAPPLPVNHGCKTICLPPPPPPLA